MLNDKAVRSGGWRAVTLAILATLILACCSSAKGTEELSWNELEPAHITRDTVAAAFLSNLPEEDGDGTVGGSVVFIDRRGGMKILATGKLPNGQIAIEKDGSISWASESTSYLVTPTAKYRVRRGDRQGLGYTVAGSNGWFAQLFNGGSGASGYTTDVYGWTGRRWAKSAVRITPGPTGVAGKTVYISDMTLDEDGRRELVSVRPGSPAHRVARWRTAGHTDGWRIVAQSHLKIARGKAWFIENVAQMPKEQPIRQPDGSLSQLRLASIDLKTGRYETRRYRNLKSASFQEDDKCEVNLVSLNLDSHLASSTSTW